MIVLSTNFSAALVAYDSSLGRLGCGGLAWPRHCVIYCIRIRTTLAYVHFQGWVLGYWQSGVFFDTSVWGFGMD